MSKTHEGATMQSKIRESVTWNILESLQSAYDPSIRTDKRAGPSAMKRYHFKKWILR
jgi:hypothetical protein